MSAPKKKSRSIFDRFSQAATHAAGTTAAFMLALSTIVVWAVTGPLFGFSDTWQLVINTGTTIVTFLMVFLIQHTQNKDSLAIHSKLNELVSSMPGANNRLIDAEDMDERELEGLHAHYQALADRAAREKARRSANPSSRSAGRSQNGRKRLRQGADSR
jgi:low affinity Fe/Cu permease